MERQLAMKSKRSNYLLPFITAALIAVVLAGVSVSAVESKTNAEVPSIHIEADRMESIEKKSAVFFTGRVEATQGDIVLQADEMTVNYLSSGGDEKTPNRKFDKLFAKGNVKLVSSAGWVATGQSMDYFAIERKAIMIGDAKVWQDNNMVSGNRIVLYLDEGKSVVESDPQQGEGRVKAYLYPGDETENNNEQPQ